MTEDDNQKEMSDADERHAGKEIQEPSLDLSPEDLQKIAAFITMIGADTR
jgi:hypothetical protein